MSPFISMRYASISVLTPQGITKPRSDTKTVTPQSARTELGVQQGEVINAQTPKRRA